MSGGVRIRDGMRTISCSRTIEGMATSIEVEWQITGSSGVAIGSARPASSKTTARRSLTSCNGSNVAFKRSTRPTELPYRPDRWRIDHLAAATTASGSSDPSRPATVDIRNAQ